jgi:hypothetical protein
MNPERAILKMGGLGFLCALAAAFSEHALTVVCPVLHVSNEIKAILVGLNPPVILVSGYLLGALWAWPDVQSRTRWKADVMLLFSYFVGMLIAGVFIPAHA